MNKIEKIKFPVINEIKKAWADKRITIKELSSILIAANERFIELADKLNLNNEAKKQFVLDSLSELFDFLWVLVPMPMFLKPFWYLITPLAKSILLSIADSTTEYIYHKLFKPKPNTPVEEKKDE